VGDSKTKHVDVRIIAATNRNLADEITQGNFREDLFYRVAIGILTLPPLKARIGDIALLADYLMHKINEDASNQPNYISKIISIKAKNIILNHSWQGNIRELHGTLLRASIWAEGEEISEADLQDAMLERPQKQTSDELLEIGEGIDINEVLDDTRKKYITQALKQSAGNKKKAAKLLNIKNYQTLTNWIDKLDS